MKTRRPRHARMLLAAVAALLLLDSSAQKIISLDMDGAGKPPTMDSLNKLKKGDFYRVEVKNINLNLYKVSLDARDTSTATALPFPTFGNFSLDALKGLIAGITGSPVSAPAINSDHPALDNSNHVQMYLPTSHGSSAIENRPGPKEKQDLDAATNLMVQQRTMLDDHLTALISIRSRMEQLRTDVAVRSVQLRTDPRNAEKQDIEGSGHATISGIVDRARWLRTDVNAQLTTANSDRNNYLLDIAPFTPLFADHKDLGAQNDRIAAAYTELLKSVDSASVAVGAKNMGAMLDPLVQLLNNANTTWTSLPQQYMGGDALVKLHIDPLVKDAPLGSYTTAIHFPTYDHWYVGVSSGLHVSDLYDQVYSNRAVMKDTATTVYRIVEENRASHEVGANALFTFGYQITPRDRFDIGLHGCVGPGVGIGTTVRPRLLYGGGISVGDHHKLMVDVGWTTGYVDRISNAYSLSTDYTAKPDKVVVSQLVTGGFVSVGYMFAF